MIGNALTAHASVVLRHINPTTPIELARCAVALTSSPTEGPCAARRPPCRTSRHAFARPFRGGERLELRR
jgi:hypothetical protein